MGLSLRFWVAGTALGAMCVSAGLWGFLAEEPQNQNVIFATVYFLLPVAILLTLAVWGGRRPGALLAAIGLLDIEAALLGFGQLISLPFVVAVPLIGVAIAARIVGREHLILPYVMAWLASSSAVAAAVLRITAELAPSAIVIIPAFLIVDALALGALWRMDVGRLAALDAAEEAEGRVRDLLNGVDLLAIHIGVDSRIDFINDFALKLTGWTREEVIGADWFATFASDDRRVNGKAEYLEVVAGGAETDRHHESTIQDRSGAVFVVRWSQVIRRDAQGHMTGMAALGENVTAARAAEEEQRRGAEMLSTLVISSPLPTAVIGLDRRIQLWNPAAFALFGWSESELVGRPAPLVLLGPSPWEIARRFVRAIKGEPFDGELVRLDRRDGTRLTVRLYGGALRDRQGRPIAVAVQAVDVTTSMELEEQLREAQKMEAVGRLAGGVAHDFNNSLTAIGGFASLIATGTKEEDTREAAETILGAAKRAADLTRELLAYSRRSLLQPQTINANELVVGLRPMVRRLLGEDISVVIDSRAPEAMIRVDPGGLERVVLNLAANARDAMPDGGHLTIAIDRRLSADSPEGSGGRWVALSVSDTGAGIPTELHSQVFDPFFTTKPVGSGTGLGLAMVKGFVVQSGGRISLLSKTGLGTTIEILLPEVSDVGSPVPVADPRTAAAGGNETILVVEDEPAVAAVSFQVLSRNGYRVLLADSGESAIVLLRGHAGRIALLLVDVILPDMRGPQVVEAARALHPESAVLYASGYSADSMGRRGDLAADVDLVEKPFAPDELLERVRSAIDGALAEAADTAAESAARTASAELDDGHAEGSA